MSKLNFNEEFVPLIISGDKVVTRRLVKEGDTSNLFKIGRLIVSKDDKVWGNCKKGNFYGKEVLIDGTGKLKWQVGKTYSVCVKGKSIWYCPECKVFCKDGQQGILVETDCGVMPKKLKVKITGISKERLLDVTDEEAKREGYLGQIDFLEKFLELNRVLRKDEHLWEYFSKKNKIVTTYKKDDELKEREILYNPFVWILEFEVVE